MIEPKQLVGGTLPSGQDLVTGTSAIVGGAAYVVLDRVTAGAPLEVVIDLVGQPDCVALVSFDASMHIDAVADFASFELYLDGVAIPSSSESCSVGTALQPGHISIRRRVALVGGVTHAFRVFWKCAAGANTMGIFGATDGGHAALVVEARLQ